jgi:hypothetical protein
MGGVEQKSAFQIRFQMFRGSDPEMGSQDHSHRRTSFELAKQGSRTLQVACSSHCLPFVSFVLWSQIRSLLIVSVCMSVAIISRHLWVIPWIGYRQSPVGRVLWTTWNETTLNIIKVSL